MSLIVLYHIKKYKWMYDIYNKSNLTILFYIQTIKKKKKKIFRYIFNQFYMSIDKVLIISGRI